MKHLLPIIVAIALAGCTPEPKQETDDGLHSWLEVVEKQSELIHDLQQQNVELMKDNRELKRFLNDERVAREDEARRQRIADAAARGVHRWEPSAPLMPIIEDIR